MTAAPERVPVERTKLELRDLTEVQDLIGSRYVDVRPRPLDTARDLLFQSATATVGPLVVDSVTLRAALEFDTDPIADPTVMCLFDGRYAAGRRGDLRRVGCGEAILFPSGEPVTIRLDRVKHHVVKFPAATIITTVGRLGVEPAAFQFHGTAPVSAAMNQHWLATAAYLTRGLAGPEPPLAYPLVLTAAIESAAAAAVAVFPNTTMTAGYTPGPGVVAPAVVRRAVAYIDAHAGEPITLADVATAAGIGVRGLQAAFARHRDSSPTGYLRRVRMERAHHDLQHGDRARGDTVAAIARRWGFATPGRFAADYHRLFGQPPSRTLRT
ncbi:helix-turn-helix transcriptional regulator [Actinoplanes palleronii]|uniref:HTH araC/xylS-type domain-containing protein n=1 Tax=Actinoplanes palleronii TaxID=113570 RepID=A0ABQ4B9D0_9ACTN|nr:AraC family transcriptional regulator [Actinoplanes palleronii]GIE67288.1 hypothetical protein Apa02nite_033960 [Actinoplanes palleronii]